MLRFALIPMYISGSVCKLCCYLARFGWSEPDVQFVSLIAVIVLADAVQMYDQDRFVVASFLYVSLPNATVIADSHDSRTCGQKQLQTVQIHHTTTSRREFLPMWPSVGQENLVTSVDTSVASSAL